MGKDPEPIAHREAPGLAAAPDPGTGLASGHRRTDAAEEEEYEVINHVRLPHDQQLPLLQGP